MSDIDFVVLWVDPNDKEWQKKKSMFSGEIIDDNPAARYRDWDNFKYWFRAVEKYAPWVKTVHLVTDDQVPEWIDTESPKLHIVSHRDYIPDDKLPLFNSNAIEIGLHKIPGLSDKFVLFNDDFFLTDYISPEYYFNKDLPNDMAGLTRIFDDDGGVFAGTILNDFRIINSSFDKKVVYKNFFKWYCPFYGKTFIRTLLNSFRKSFDGLVMPHLSTPYLKNDFIKVWDIYGEELAETQSHKFRQYDDYTHFVFRFYRMCNGCFNPKKSTGKYYYADKQSAVDIIADAIIKRKYPEICINDGWKDGDFDKAKKTIIDAFKTVLPEKSSFEK